MSGFPVKAYCFTKTKDMRKWIVLAAFLMVGYIKPLEGVQNPLRNELVKPKQQNTAVDLRTKYHIPKKFGQKEIDTVLFYSKTLRIPENICFNLIYIESRFDSTAVNKKTKCAGYAQLHPKYFTFTDRFDNLKQGFEYLKKLFDKHGDWKKALQKYSTSHINYILDNGTIR
jgi:hypothetical protein